MWSTINYQAADKTPLIVAILTLTNCTQSSRNIQTCVEPVNNLSLSPSLT